MSEQDKVAEFRRINEPRAQRAIGQLGHIEKSAKSMKIHKLDVARLLQPVSERLSAFSTKMPSRCRASLQPLLSRLRRPQSMLIG